VPKSAPEEESASSKITKRTGEFDDWRGETLAHLRQLIHDADPDIEEEWKWVKPSSPGFPSEPRRRGVHWRSVQTGGEAHVLSRRDSAGPETTLQLEPGRERTARHRRPRRREDQRDGIQTTDSGRGRGQPGSPR